MSDGQDQGHSKEQPIIIKKVKKGGHGGHHGGAWKVAYADFVTAMMALFIVLWILASSEQVKMAVAAYYDDPGAFSFVTGKRTIPIDLEMQQEQGKGDKEGEGKGDMVISFSQDMRDSVIQKLIEQAKGDSVSAAQKVVQMEGELQKLLNELVADKPEFQKILDNIKIEITKEGLRIELMETTENVFFQVGSAQLTKQAVDVLKMLSEEIGKLPNNVVIEGHTDSRKYSASNGYSNWELSADRANAARKVLTYGGLWEGQIIQVAGYADKRLRTPQNPFDVTNRRVSILVKQLSSEQFLPTTTEKPVNEVETNHNSEEE